MPRSPGGGMVSGWGRGRCGGGEASADGDGERRRAALTDLVDGSGWTTAGLWGCGGSYGGGIE
jgi:hypothetical protein